jgi:hypothetical protein
VSRRGIGGFWRSLQRQLGELLGRVGEGEALARPDVEFVGGGVELGSGDGEEVGALGEVLAQQPVGVLVGSALPGSVRIAEEDVDAGVDVDLLPVAHLRALVSTCARHELRMVRGAADSRDRVPRRKRELAPSARPGRRVRAGVGLRRRRRRRDGGVHQAGDASIGEGASERPALPPRSP